MGKSKKRNRTKALYEAATAAKRRISRAKGDVVTSSGLVTDDSTINVLQQKYTTTKPGVAQTSTQDQGEPRNGASDGSASKHEGEPTQSDIATTLRTIRYLVRFPDIFLHSKDFKLLRGALHPLITERLRSYDKGIDYRQRVTVHLSHKRWSAALSSLAAAKDFQQIPKQGTVQRWVRDVDLCEEGPVKIKLLASILGFQNNAGIDRSSNKNSSVGTADRLQYCDDDGDGENTSIAFNKHDPAVALIEAQKSYNEMKRGNSTKCIGVETNTNDELKILEGWRIPSSSSLQSCNGHNGDNDDLETLESRIVYMEYASERTPPNRYDLLLHATKPFAVFPLMKVAAASAPNNKILKHEVPFLTGAFALENVLSHAECSRLVRAASILGYRPDHPTNLSSPTGIDSCEWLVDDSIHDLVYDRVREHLPLSVSKSNITSDGNDKDSHGGGEKPNALCGINKRWRFFRYGQDCVYRPHIDGSWPAGSLSEDGMSYEQDVSGRTRSYLTFLIYLNDGFEGGQTRFFYPEEHGATSLVARGIVPHKGSVLIFPQGNTASLLHEGSAVTKGTKYVVRTDVLYKH